MPPCECMTGSERSGRAPDSTDEGAKPGAEGQAREPSKQREENGVKASQGERKNSEGVVEEALVERIVETRNYVKIAFHIDRRAGSSFSGWFVGL